MCFLLLKPSPNAFKFCMSFNTLHKKWAICPIIQKKIYMFVLKPFYMTGKMVSNVLMTKIIHNLSTWLKEKLYI